VLRPLDPAQHLPHLSGRFLLIAASEDTIVTAAASRRLEELTPSPKQSILLPGDHVGAGPDRVAELEDAMAATRRWLVANGAANGP
jgi:hypothetical protein